MIQNAHLVTNARPHTPEWHQARASRIGGSDVAAILGLSPWESRFSLWHRKAGISEGREDNPQMSWGRRLEPVVADAFAENHPELDVAETGTWVNEIRPYQLANPDRLLTDNHGGGEVLEIKTARDDIGWGIEGTDEIPVYYRCQTLWYLDCLELNTAHVAVLIGGSDYREYVINMKDVAPEEIQLIRDCAEKLIRSVESRERPPIDGSTATYQVVKQLPDGVLDEAVELDAQTVTDYTTSLDEFRRAESEKRRATSHLLDIIDDAKRAEFLGERVATRTVHPDGSTKSLIPARRK